MNPVRRMGLSALLLTLTLAAAGCGEEGADPKAPLAPGVSAVGAGAATFRAAFDAGNGKPRVVALVSPT